jgi:alpha-L-fucosidase
MNARLLLIATLAAAAAASCRTGAAPRPPEPVAAAPAPAVAAPPASEGDALEQAPAMAWWRASMATREQRIGWFRQSRFGMFIHWGAYSDLGGVWEGQPVKGYAEHIQRMRKIPMAVYREKVVAPFNPTGFDADEWVRAAKRAGMGYLIITAKHHDGFAMYDSEVSDYDIVQATRWKRDPMRALKEASDRHGIRFGFYYSHAFDWGDRFGPGNDWEWQNPGGDKLLHGGRNWYDATPALVPQVRRYVDEKSIPQVRELIKKYDPAILWFDTPHKLPIEENLRILRAARETKPDLVVNGRICQEVPGGPPERFGDYASTVDKPAEFPPHDGDWEAIPTTNESYGWHKMDGSHKPPEHFVQLLVKAAARGGNVLLNVGPMGNGKLDPRDLKILDAVGAWMQVNGESIHGTTRTPLPVQAWGESTRKGNTLYLHVFHWPRGNRLVVGGLTTPAKRAWLLADRKAAALSVDRAGPQDLIIDLPAPRAGAAPSPDTVVALELEAEPVADSARLVGTAVPVDTLRAFDGRLQGRGLRFGTGKTRDAYVHGWSDAAASVRWPLRAREKVTFEVLVSYDAPATSAGGAFAVKLGATSLPGTVAETPAAPVSLGKVTLEPGPHDLAVEATKIQGGELMRLRAVILKPI